MTDHADEMADRLLDAVFDGDVDLELAAVADQDAPAVLGAVIRGLASQMAARHLAVQDPETTAADEPAPDGISNPWSTNDRATEALMAARLLWDALAGQENVAGLLRGVRAIDEDEARAVVLERALVSMAERPPGNR